MARLALIAAALKSVFEGARVDFFDIGYDIGQLDASEGIILEFLGPGSLAGLGEKSLGDVSGNGSDDFGAAAPFRAFSGISRVTVFVDFVRSGGTGRPLLGLGLLAIAEMMASTTFWCQEN